MVSSVYICKNERNQSHEREKLEDSEFTNIFIPLIPLCCRFYTKGISEAYSLSIANVPPTQQEKFEKI
jgi:hypothetical protein